jgi:hypothetical protein
MANLNDLTLSYWLGKDVSELLEPYYRYTKGFHVLPVKNCYLYLNSALEVSPSYVIKNERLKLPAAEVYDLKAGSKQGVRFGFLIRSPLPCKADKNYLIFYRKQIDPKEIVLEKHEAHRKYQIGELLFFAIDDDAVMISKVEKSDFIDSLEQ